jgi:hypothetical protein
MKGDWDRRLEQWRIELDLAASLEAGSWVPLARAEKETGVSRSALRSWYRDGQIRTRLVDGPHGPQRLVSLDEVTARAAQSPRIRRRAEDAVVLESQIALLRHRLDQLEHRTAALERLLSQPPAATNPSGEATSYGRGRAGA